MTQLPHADTQDILDCALDVAGRARPSFGALLDLPCGSGYLSMRARDCGWNVTPADMDTDRWAGDPALQVQYANLNEALPFADHQFDAIVCCEGIEHVENPWHVLREFRRVVRPDGILVISLPNTIDIRQRMRLFRRGHVSHYFPHVPTHVNVMGPYVLCQALLHMGFRIRDVQAATVYGNALTKAATRWFRFGKRSDLPDEVRRMLSHERILRTRNPILCAEVAPG